MTLIEKLDKILLEKRLKIVDFLELTGISKTSYYAIKKGHTKKISVNNAKKISDTFNEYSYEWLVGKEKDDEVNKVVTESPTIKTSIGKISIKELAYITAVNFTELEKESVFYNAVLVKAINILQEASDEKGNVDLMKFNTKN